jgi:hypothetical protein
MKFVFPALWIPLFGLGPFILWSGLARGKHGELPPEAMKYVFAIVWLAGTSFILWVGIQLKRVRIDGSNLYVSDWFHEMVIPMAEIADVKEHKWIKGHPIIILFKRPTACGKSVMFLPILRLAWWSEHPIVKKLKELAGNGEGSE